MSRNRKSLLFFVFALLCLSNNSCTYMPDLGICENTAEKEIISPNNKLKVVIFDRSCGATVGFITGISIISTDEKIHNNDSGNILFAENVYREFSHENGKIQYGKINFDAQWMNDEKLLVFYTESKNLRKKESYKNIEIRYEYIPKQ